MASKASRLGRATQHIQHDSGTVMYGLKRYGCSAFSAALAESITFPCDTVCESANVRWSAFNRAQVKVHQQLQGRSGGEASSKTSIVNTVRNIVKSEGPIGIYRGVIPAVLRQVPPVSMPAPVAVPSPPRCSRLLRRYAQCSSCCCCILRVVSSSDVTCRCPSVNMGR